MTAPDPALVERVKKAVFAQACFVAAGVVELAVVETLAALRESGRLVEDGARWRHVKRGTFYAEIGRAELQMAADVVDGSELVIYRSNDGKWWARQEDEFHDGRFIVAPPATAATEGE